ncbi:hypothetical protein CspeluHIS016_0103530 [Cutaneotrichosporon spelunceum]|uniref:Helicase C-terminal domain-containing protein n=1 Tax=Cutaneotrichosporon spelunceum TaxID=1672016 RepID=A0AAD3Y9G1_9TREE|nr:hypothetical protein CspeluHIS016_0103530 [Cutaneotrichosporon spelunceum]
MSRVSSATNILMEMRKLFQHPGKLLFLKQLLPRLKERGHRVLLFSQFKIALDLIEDFLSGEGYKYLRLDGDVNQLHRQKDVDKFNAPDSEYFIFLLTTRAGGVGINLASADTVIMHDPDFNPHQDLQAISRAHRYGQTKRVLVFKLMMENSAEGTPLSAQTLTPNHLVVQQLGKDREEGEYENLILYGAEDITKIDEDASSMRVWTPKMIDDLIDDAEREAEEMAKVQETAEAAKAASQENDDASKANGFSFAKIWETKVEDVAVAGLDEPEIEPEFDEHGWVQFLQQAEATEAAQREAARAVEGRLRAMKKKVKYTLESAEFGRNTPEKKKRKKRKGKEPSQDADSGRDTDDDFVPGPDLDLISDDEDLSTDEGPRDFEDLSNEQRTIIGGLAAGGKRKLTNHERVLLQRWHSLDEKKRAEALVAASASNFTARFSETRSVVAVFYFIDSGEPMDLVVHPAPPSMKPTVQPAMPSMNPAIEPAPRPMNPFFQTALRPSNQPQPPASLGHPHNGFTTHVNAGPQMYQGPSPGSKFVAHQPTRPMLDPAPEPTTYPVPQPITYPTPYSMFYPAPEPMTHPVPHPAQHTVTQSIPPFKNQPVPASQPQTQIHLSPQPLPPHRLLPPSGGASSIIRSIQAGPEPTSVAGPSNPIRIAELPLRPATNGNASTETSVLARDHEPEPPSTLDPHQSNVSSCKIVQLSSDSLEDTGAQPVIGSSMQLGDSSRFEPRLYGDHSEKAEEWCYWCQQDHNLRDCPGLLSWGNIKSYREGIEASNDTAEAKASGLEALSMMETARKERDEIDRKKSKKRPRNSASGTEGDPIEVDVDSRPPSRPVSVVGSKRARTATTFHGCQVCHDEEAHTLAACPIILAGADSIKAALRDFEAGSPTHDMLSKFLRAVEIGIPAGAIEPCAYCNTSCAMTVRECAEVRGKRKDLKQKIRQIDQRVLPSNEERLRVLKGRRATVADWELPSLERQISDAEREVFRLERVLARLYKAYAEWPNPKTTSLGGKEQNAKD